MEVATAALVDVGADLAKALVNRLEHLDVQAIVSQVPPGRMSEPAREFAVRVGEANRARILSHPTLTMDP